VQPGERDENAGDDEDVEREEARQRPAGDDRRAQEQVDECRADDRRPRGNGRADAEAPVGVLVHLKICPVKAIPSVHSSMNTPTIHVSSRGYL